MKLLSGLLVISVFFAIGSCSSNEDCDEIFETKTFVVDKKYCINSVQHMKITDLVDGRCPIDANCIWEGYLEVVLNWHQSDVTINDTIQIHSKSITFNNLSLGEYKIVIDSIEPSQILAFTDPEDYKIHMKVTKQ